MSSADKDDDKQKVKELNKEIEKLHRENTKMKKDIEKLEIEKNKLVNMT